MNDHTGNHDLERELPDDLASIAIGVDALSDALRRRPDAGFESRIAENAARAATGTPTLRLTGHAAAVADSADSPAVRTASLRSNRAATRLMRIAAALLLVGGGVGLAWTWLSGSQPAAPADPSPVQLASATDLEIAEIADAWDALDDSELATRFDDVSARVSSVSDAVGSSWTASWMEEDSM